MAKILIVDDDKNTAETLKRHLEAAGHTCTIESSGVRAIDAARAVGHDVVVLDVMLPGVSGFEICRRIRRDADLYTLPVLILSAMSSEEEVMHGLSQGADDYVTKPFDINNLIQRIESLVRANSDMNAVDALTSLPGADSTKRELQRRISRQTGFGVAYVELTQIREFSYRCGAEARGKAIRRLGRALVQCGADLQTPDLLAGHMGGGHFVCVMEPSACESFCGAVYKIWTENLGRLYMSLGLEREYNATVNKLTDGPRIPLLNVLCCITTHDGKESVNSKQVFEILSHIRHRALESQSGGIHRDRRAVAG
ncbi:MAG: response regulator [Candidatus Hydrogenedentes bacterium]|nr:response regulator [Candidatus Hydrogenedentota bacterium]